MFVYFSYYTSIRYIECTIINYKIIIMREITNHVVLIAFSGFSVRTFGNDVQAIGFLSLDRREIL